jgi:hypothetical protein
VAVASPTVGGCYEVSGRYLGGGGGPRGFHVAYRKDGFLRPIRRSSSDSSFKTVAEAMAFAEAHQRNALVLPELAPAQVGRAVMDKRPYVKDIAEECFDVAEGDVDRAMALFNQMTNADEELRQETRQWMMVLKTYGPDP